MMTIRRWYIFLVCAVSLQAVAWAVIWLLRGMLLPRMYAEAELFSVQIAIVVIGLPIFIWHWRKVSSPAQSRTEDGHVDLGPFPIYLYGMLAGFIMPMVANSVTLLQALFSIAFSLSNQPLPSDLLPGEAGVHSGVALAVLAGLTLVFRRIDGLAREAVSEHLADVRRGFMLGLSAVGLSLTVSSLIGMLRWLIFQIGGGGAGIGITIGMEWVSMQAARLLVGMALWQIPWLRAQTLFVTGGTEERESVLRKLYLYTLVFVGSLTVVTNAAMFMAEVLRSGLSLESAGEMPIALITMAVFGMVWVYHAFVLRRDASLAADVPNQAVIKRIYLYIVATIGLGALLIGVGGDISVLIMMVNQNGFGHELREQVAGYSAALLAGLPVWIIAWWKVQLAARSSELIGRLERQSTVRKIYLYFFLFVATITVLTSAVVILSQFLNLALGAQTSEDFPNHLAHTLAYSSIAAGVWVYHRACLREDGDQEDAERHEHATDVRVMIMVPGYNDLGAALDSAMREEFPGLITELDPSPGSMADLSEKDIVVATGDAAGVVAGSSARKLLLPLPRPGWNWVGAPLRSQQHTIKETLHAIGYLIAGERVRPLRRFSGGARIAIAIGVLLLLVNVVMVLITNITN